MPQQRKDVLLRLDPSIVARIEEYQARHDYPTRQAATDDLLAHVLDRAEARKSPLCGAGTDPKTRANLEKARKARTKPSKTTKAPTKGKSRRKAPKARKSAKKPTTTATEAPAQE